MPPPEKKELGTAAWDDKRSWHWPHQAALAIEAELDPEFSEKFIRFVIDEVIRHHKTAAGK